MSDTPNYRFYKNPRFSANHLADYLCTTNAPQRERLVRDAKFPKKAQIIAYQSAIPIFRDFLQNGNRDRSYLDLPKECFVAKAARETGWPRDEALRCVKAIEAFSETYGKSRLAKLDFGQGPSSVGLKVSGVNVHCRLDPPIREKNKNGVLHSGGCVIFLATSAQSRKNIEERAKYVAATVHWALEENQTNVDPLPRLCLSLDVFGGIIVRAPAAFDRLRERRWKLLAVKLPTDGTALSPRLDMMGRPGNRV